MSRWLIIFGVVLIAAGLLWPLLQKIGLGRLSGDIVIERKMLRFYFPIVTSLIISIVLSLVLWLLRPASWSATSSTRLLQRAQQTCNFCMPPIRVINLLPSCPR